jgi:hypothetical protein
MLLLLFLPLSGGATSYYVSPSGSGSTCSQASPCSLTTGLTKPQAGDTLLLRGGTYRQTIDASMGLQNGTSATAVVTIAAAPGETVWLVPPSGEAGILINGNAGAHRWLVFDGVNIDMGLITSTDAHCVNMDGKGNSHLRVTNMECKNAGHHFNPGGGGQGIAAREGTAYEFDHNRVHDNGASWRDHGIYICGVGSSIHDNEVYRNSGFGIQIYDSAAPGCANDITITNNRIHDNARSAGGGGITLSHGSRMMVYNNLLYNNKGIGIDIAFQGAGGSLDQTQIYHNTLVGHTPFALQIQPQATGTHIKNNIVQQAPVAVNDLNGRVSYAGNLCDTAGVGCTIVGSANFASTDPTDPAFLRLQASSTNAVQRGVALPMIRTDLSGTLRPQETPPDLGAYAFVPAPTPIAVYVAPSGDDTRSCTTATNPATPRETLAEGLKCLTTPGSTLTLRAGTYVEVLDTGTQRIAGGTSWEAPTTIAAYGDERVTLLSPRGSFNLVTFQNAAQDHYIVLDRLTLDCNHRIWTNGVVFNPGVHHVRFQRGEIKHCYWELAYINGAHQTEIVTSRLHDHTHEHAVNIVGGSDGTRIQGNTIWHSVGAGVQADSSYAPPGTQRQTTILGNIIHDVGAATQHAAIIIGGSDVLVANNLVYGTYAGVRATQGTTSGKIYNNTLCHNTTVGLQVDPGVSGALLTNNIVCANGTGQIVDQGTDTVQTTNLQEVPPFVNVGQGDYHLAATATAAMGTGTVLREVPTDLDGRPRPPDAAYDLGAYVGGTTVAPPLQ